MSITGATADAAGNIYATSGSTIYKLDDHGNILGSLNTSFALDNIKISPTDQLLSDNNGGQIVLTTTALTSYSEWSLNEPNAQLYESFADFVTPAPEPGAITIVGVLLLMVLLRRSRPTRKVVE